MTSRKSFENKAENTKKFRRMKITGNTELQQVKVKRVVLGKDKKKEKGYRPEGR